MDNVNLFFWIFNLNGQSWILDKSMVFGADKLIYLLILFIFILGIKGDTKDKKAFLLCLFGIPTAYLIIQIIHLFIFEPRPFITFHFTPIVKEAMDASFPSRHATIASLIAFSFYFFRSKWSVFFLSLAAWIGLGRVYVGVHYPLDILGGFLVSIIAIAITLKLKKFIYLRWLRI